MAHREQQFWLKAKGDPPNLKKFVALVAPRCVPLHSLRVDYARGASGKLGGLDRKEYLVLVFLDVARH